MKMEEHYVEKLKQNQNTSQEVNGRATNGSFKLTMACTCIGGVQTGNPVVTTHNLQCLSDIGFVDRAATKLILTITADL